LIADTQVLVVLYGGRKQENALMKRVFHFDAPREKYLVTPQSFGASNNRFRQVSQAP
jgi:hypothetical protein